LNSGLATIQCLCFSDHQDPYLRFTEFGMIIWQDVQRMAGNDREGRILASMLRNITSEGLAGTKLWAPDLHYLTEAFWHDPVWPTIAVASILLKGNIFFRALVVEI